MKKILFVSAVLLGLSGCAAIQQAKDEHAAHHPEKAPAASAAPTARYDQQMKMMQAMHQKMMAAKTPEERQALMAEHMKAMQGGMSMMCEMGSGGAGMNMGAGSGAGMGLQGSTGSADMMKRCMDMRDMTTRMMMDREASKPPASK